MKKAFAQFLVETHRIKSDLLEAGSGINWSTREPIGRLALLHGIIEPPAIDKVLARQENSDEFFGQIAIRMGLLTPEQLSTLLVGQALRGCAEALEDLVLSGHLTLSSGVTALAEFLASEHFQPHLIAEAERSR